MQNTSQTTASRTWRRLCRYDGGDADVDGDSGEWLKCWRWRQNDADAHVDDNPWW